MNCDQVFDVLTRGPFPTGAPCDAAVEAHLDACADCRRLAEALRPAVELFQEAVDPEESRDLPGYWGAAAQELKRTSVSFAPEVESLPRMRGEVPAARTQIARAAWGVAAMLALGVTLGTLASSRWVLDGSAPRGLGPGMPLAPLIDRGNEPRGNLADHLELAVLPAACFRKPGAEQLPGAHGERSLAGVERASLNCCSACHHGGADPITPVVSNAATVTVARSCQLCHTDVP